jgi:hypothetical protein
MDIEVIGMVVEHYEGETKKGDPYQSIVFQEDGSRIQFRSTEVDLSKLPHMPFQLHLRIKCKVMVFSGLNALNIESIQNVKGGETPK